MTVTLSRDGAARKASTATSTLNRRQRRGSLRELILSAVAWICGLIFFFPILWMFLLSFRSESDAGASPPRILAPVTLAQYLGVFDSGITAPLINSVTATVLSTVLVMVLAFPAAYSLAIRPVPNTRGVLGFLLSTKFLPQVAGLLPLYLVFQKLGMLDNIYALVIFYTAMNLPIAVWMLRSFLLEIPFEILEAAQMDGAGFLTTFRRIILPMTSPGLAAVGLICTIFAWNEFLFAVNLTATRAATLPVFLASFVTSEGLFVAQLSAAAVLVSLPILLFGWIAQDKLVSGLSMGAVK